MLKEILSISGKPGLQKLISNSSNAIIVESLIDGKRFPAYSNSKIIALEDISIYTEAEDMPLKEVFKRMKKFWLISKRSFRNMIRNGYMSRI